MHRPTSRRQFLRRSLLAAGATFLAACSRAVNKVVPPSPTVSSPPTSTVVSPAPAAYDPARDAALKIDTRWPIKRVVYLMLENRSFDNSFGAFPGVNGARTGNDLGREVPLIRCPQWLPSDLPHDWGAAVADVNGGKMDNFRLPELDPAVTQGAKYFAYSQVAREDVPNYWHWAKENVLCDNLFASVLGPSYPNHLVYVSGDHFGVFDNPENSRPVPVPEGGRSKSWGCDSPPNVWTYLRAPDGSLTKSRPCFPDAVTVPNQLTDKKIDWAYYAPNMNQVGYIWSTLNSFPSIFKTDLWDRHVKPVDGLLEDVAASALPSVSWIVARYELSDHPPWSSTNSHNWVTKIVNGIMRGPLWEHTAIFITWDEWGGFYDHVPPPHVDQNGFGIRVPMLVISPYTKRGLIDHELGEFSSPLKFIQDNWGMPHHTERIRKTHNFEHVFDFHGKPRPPDPQPVVPNQGNPYVHPMHDPAWPKSFKVTDLGH